MYEKVSVTVSGTYTRSTCWSKYIFRWSAKSGWGCLMLRSTVECNSRNGDIKKSTSRGKTKEYQ
jgi:hypothetical protein